jgi:cysteine-rich repeat protein
MLRVVPLAIVVLVALVALSACPEPVHHVGEGEGEGAAGGEGEGEGHAGEGEGEGEGKGGEGEGEGEGLGCFFQCSTPACENAPECAEDCGNFIDDNFDGLLDCRDDPRCFGTPACASGPTPVGGPCTKPSDCTASNNEPECFHTSPVDGAAYANGSCSAFCTSDADCGGVPGFCLQVTDPTFFGGTTGVCMKGCSVDADCGDATLICGLPSGAAAGTPSFCVPAPVCGNGKLETREQCDDGNTVDGDGCSSTCTIEACNDVQALPALQLGANSGDTSTSTSKVFQGSCFTDANEGGATPEVTSIFQPDAPGRLFAKVHAVNADGSPNANAGVNFALYAQATCGDRASELACTNEGSAATPSDGPSLVANVNDAANPVVVVVDSPVSGAGPYVLDVAYHDALCGNGVREGGEACDGADFGATTCAQNSAGTFGPLTCSATCDAIDFSGCVTVDAGNREVEPNDTPPSQVNVYADPFFGSFQTINDTDCVSFTATAGSTMSTFFEDTVGGSACNAGFFAGLTAALSLRDATNNILVQQIGCNTPVVATAPTDGTYFACLANFGVTGVDYHLVVDVEAPVCGDGVAEGNEPCDVFDVKTPFCTASNPATFGPATTCLDDCTLDTSACAPIEGINETEPNNDPSSANGFVAPFIGTIDPLGDVDCVSIDANAGDHIAAEVQDLGDGACSGGAIDSVLDFFDASGIDVLTVDDGGAGKCSKGSLEAPVSGTYAVCVSAKGNATRFGYALAVDVLPPGCANGAFSECSLGTSGCSPTCQIQECATPLAAQLGDNNGNVVAGGSNLLASDPNGACLGAGDNSPEQVWSYVPDIDATLTVSITASAAEASSFMVYARTACASHVDVSCSNGLATPPSTISIAVKAGETVFLVVDTSTSVSNGAYTMTLSQQ